MMAQKKKRKDPAGRTSSRRRFLRKYADMLAELLRVNPCLKPSKGLKEFKSVLIAADGQLPDDLPTTDGGTTIFLWTRIRQLKLFNVRRIV